ncbi:MAG: hypothetical protein QGI63_03550 [Rhodospirillales bacterium]|jgi:hypothetical protein|nr:hypothetical protein [Rhodospirillales bacterium]
MSVELAALGAALAAIGSILVYTLRTGITPMPTSRRVKAAMIELVPDGFEGTIVELGSGWGTLAMAFARRYPGCQVLAYELSPLPWLFSRLWCAVAPLANLRVHRADFHEARLHGAGLVVCYLHPGAMERLRPKLEAELTPGALVLSNTFAMPRWRPVAVAEAEDFYRSKVYLYRIAA